MQKGNLAGPKKYLIRYKQAPSGSPYVYFAVLEKISEWPTNTEQRVN